MTKPLCPECGKAMDLARETAGWWCCSWCHSSEGAEIRNEVGNAVLLLLADLDEIRGRLDRLEAVKKFVDSEIADGLKRVRLEKAVLSGGTISEIRGDGRPTDAEVAKALGACFGGDWVAYSNGWTRMGTTEHRPDPRTDTDTALEMFYQWNKRLFEVSQSESGGSATTVPVSGPAFRDGVIRLWAGVKP